MRNCNYRKRIKKIAFLFAIFFLVISCSSKKNAVKTDAPPKTASIQSENLPQASDASSKTLSSVKYNVAIDDKPVGPFTIDELKQMARKGQFTKESQVWKEGMSQWEPAGSIAELAPLFQTAPEPPRAVPPETKYSVAENGMATGLLTLNELKQMAQNGQLTRESLIWEEDTSQWTIAGNIAELTPFFQSKPSSGANYFIVVNSQPSGPLSLEDLKNMVKNRKLTRNDLVWKDGMPQWTASEAIPELADLFPTIPPPPPPQPQSSPLYYVAVNGKPTGPFTLEEVAQKSQNGQINRNALIWKEDMPQWVSAGNVAELGSLFAANSSSQASQTNQTDAGQTGAVKYHIAVNGLATGPFLMEELKQKASTGQLTKNTQVWKSGMSQWAPAGSVGELTSLFDN
jgi:hypothetical protein